MITFTIKDDNKQFISINTDENANIDIVTKEIRKQYPSLKQLHIISDEVEILIPLETSFPYGFSLNELREYLKTITTAIVSHFAVDMDASTQRYYG